MQRWNEDFNAKELSLIRCATGSDRMVKQFGGQIPPECYLDCLLDCLLDLRTEKASSQEGLNNSVSSRQAGHGGGRNVLGGKIKDLFGVRKGGRVL